MRTNRLTLLLIGAAVATGASAARLTDAERMDKALKGYVAGKEVDCIRQSPTRQSTTFNGAILYEESRRTLYLNRFEGGCNINPGNILVTRSFTGQLCRGDISRIVDAAGRVPVGSCVFGKFTTYTKAK